MDFQDLLVSSLFHSRNVDAAASARIHIVPSVSPLNAAEKNITDYVKARESTRCGSRFRLFCSFGRGKRERIVLT